MSIALNLLFQSFVYNSLIIYLNSSINKGSTGLLTPTDPFLNPLEVEPNPPVLAVWWEGPLTYYACKLNSEFENCPNPSLPLADTWLPTPLNGPALLESRELPLIPVPYLVFP